MELEQYVPLEDRDMWRLELSLVYKGPESTVKIREGYGPWIPDKDLVVEAFDRIAPIIRGEPIGETLRRLRNFASIKDCFGNYTEEGLGAIFCNDCQRAIECKEQTKQ